MKRNLICLLLFVMPLLSFSQEIDLLILNNENEKALQLIDNKIKIDSLQPLLYLKKGIVLQKLYDYTGALKSLETAYQLDSMDLNILNEIAETNTSLGNHQQAFPYYKALYDADTTNIVNTLKLVRSFFNRRIFREPYEMLQLIYRRDSSNVFINKQLALSAARTGNDSIAILMYRKVIGQNPSDLSNYTNLASLYQNKDKYNEVIETLEKGLAVYPDESILLLKLGETHYHKRDYSKAIIPYEKYLTKGDSVHDVMKNLGISYFFEKREEEGLFLLEKCLQMNPDDPIVGLYIGLCCKELNDLDKSIDYLNFAAKISIPYYLSDIYHHLGNVYGLNRDFKKSIAALEKAYELDTTKAMALFEIATTYEEMQKDKTQAIKYYNAYLKANKENNTYYQKLTDYALTRLRKIEEDNFFEGKKP